MKSKVEILSAHEYDVHYYGGGRKHILEAMEEYAKQESIKFYEFFAKTSVSNPDKLWKMYQDNVQSK